MSDANEVYKRVPKALCDYMSNIFVIHLVLLKHGINVLHHMWQEGIHCHHILQAMKKQDSCEASSRARVWDGIQSA